MAIYRHLGSWTIEESDFFQTGFASRDEARKFNADRKAGLGNEPAPTAVKAVKEKVVSYLPTDIKVDRGTDGKWFFIHKQTGVELQVAPSRDDGRERLSKLKAAGGWFIPDTKVSAVTKINTNKPTTVVNTTLKVETPKSAVCQPKKEKSPLDCVISTGISAYRNSKKFTVGRQPKDGCWKIKVNGAHIGTVYTSYEDACEACRYIMTNRVLSI